MLFFKNSEPQNAGFVEVQNDLNFKRSKGFLVRKNKKISIVIKNAIGSEDALMHKAECLGNYFCISFTHYNQAELIKKGVTCVQILLGIHLTEQSRTHLQR